MVQVPTIATSRLQLQPVDAQQVSLGSSNAPDAFGAIGAAQLQANGELMQEIAREEDKVLRKKERLRMYSELERFDQETLEVTNRFEQRGTGDENFVDAVMSNVNSRSEEFINEMPNFLRDEARVRLLPKQTRAAKNALATQNLKIEEQQRQDWQTFNNNIINSVRYGGLDPQAALEQINSASEDLPETIKESARQASIGSLRQAALHSAFDPNDPQRVIERIDSGEFNDVDPTVVGRVRTAAKKQIVKQQEQFAKLRNEAVEDRFDDPRLAAEKLLQSEGVTAPSFSEIQVAQDRLGVPRHKQAVMTKEQSNALSDALNRTQTLEEFFLIRDEELEERAAQNGVTPEDLKRDLVRFSDSSPAYRMLLDSDVDNVDSRALQAMYAMTKNSSVHTESRRRINEMSGNGASKEIELKVNELISDRVTAMARSDIDTEDRNDFTETARRIGLLVYEEALSDGAKKPVRIMEQAINSLGGGSVVRVQGKDGYEMDPFIAQRLTEKVMSDAKSFVGSSLAPGQVREFTIRENEALPDPPPAQEQLEVDTEEQPEQDFNAGPFGALIDSVRSSVEGVFDNDPEAQTNNFQKRLFEQQSAWVSDGGGAIALTLGGDYVNFVTEDGPEPVVLTLEDQVRMAGSEDPLLEFQEIIIERGQ